MLARRKKLISKQEALKMIKNTSKAKTIKLLMEFLIT